MNPNPTSGWITFDTEAGLIQSLELMSLDGRILLQKEQYFISGEKQQLNMADVHPGMYVLRLGIDGKLYAGKIVKL